MTELRRLRKDRGFSVKEIASAAGVSIMSIYRYETGRRKPDIDIAAKIAAKLGCTIEALMEKKGA